MEKGGRRERNMRKRMMRRKRKERRKRRIRKKMVTRERERGKREAKLLVPMTYPRHHTTTLASLANTAPKDQDVSAGLSPLQIPLSVCLWR